MKDSTTILFIWKVDPKLKEHLILKLDDLALKMIFPEPAEEQAYFKYAEEADVIVGWKPTKELLTKAINLKLLINPGAGVQHLMKLLKTIPKERGIQLVNGHGNAHFTAQHIVAMLLSVCNRIVPHHNWMIEGRWRLGDKEAKSIPLQNKTVGLLGYGHINKIVHELLTPHGCVIKVCRKHPEQPEEYPVESLEEFLSAIDTLIVTLPDTEESRGLIGEKELELLGRDAIIVNAGRGNVIDEAAFYTALKDKTIAQAAIDVWYDYKPDQDKQGRKFPSNFPFYELDNVLLSPHRAASPFDDLNRWDDVIENIKRFEENKPLLNLVDIDLGY